MDKLFLHVCCGPCACFPLEKLKLDHPGLELDIWFYNPNIHPKAEYRRRRDTLAYLAAKLGLKIDFSAPYDPERFLSAFAKNPEPPDRCRACYALRLSAAAEEAAKRNHKFLATTLAFSKRQKHDLIIEEGHKAAARHGLNFYYEDWRPGWQRGHELAKSYELYRQNFCGCIYSELERF